MIGPKNERKLLFHNRSKFSLECGLSEEELFLPKTTGLVH